ncbi:MAG: hypothetical protein Q4D79_05495 [Propionibacteriaceae bacterium]|nr:hypothetical protein [Propionibacteriaceae bacterium]
MTAPSLSKQHSKTITMRTPAPSLRLRPFASLRMQGHVFFGNRTVLLNVLAGLIAMAGLAGAVAFSVANSYRGGQPLDDPMFVRDIAIFGFPFAQVFLGVAAILFVCSEWSSGFIYTSHSALQQPLGFVVAKAAWPALTCALGSTVMMLLEVPVESWLLSDTPYSISLLDADVWRQIGALALSTVCAVSFATGIALWLRNSAPALGVYIAVTLIAPIIVGQIPMEAARHLSNWLPNNVFNSLITNNPGVTSTLNYPLVIAAAVAYPLIALTFGAIRLERRVV